MWHMTRDTWHRTSTRDMWHMVGDEHSPKSSAPQLLRFGIDIFLKIWNKRITQWITQWNNEEGVYITAPATQGLLKRNSGRSRTISSQPFLSNLDWKSSLQKANKKNMKNMCLFRFSFANTTKTNTTTTKSMWFLKTFNKHKFTIACSQLYTAIASA